MTGLLSVVFQEMFVQVSVVPSVPLPITSSLVHRTPAKLTWICDVLRKRLATWVPDSAFSDSYQMASGITFAL